MVKYKQLQLSEIQAIGVNVFNPIIIDQWLQNIRERIILPSYFWKNTKMQQLYILLWSQTRNIQLLLSYCKLTYVNIKMNYHYTVSVSSDLYDRSAEANTFHGKRHISFCLHVLLLFVHLFYFGQGLGFILYYVLMVLWVQTNKGPNTNINKLVCIKKKRPELVLKPVWHVMNHTESFFYASR